jgi:aryl-alcohol dehydrogenase-like predicted oxidoreductase
MFKKKLIIGTANFSEKYGLDKKKVKKKDVGKIIKIALKNKILYIDTAQSYQNVEKELGSHNLKKFKIINKIKIPSNTKNIFDTIINNVKKSLKLLKISSFEVLLLHNSADLNVKNKLMIIEALKYLRNNYIIKKFGISIYSTRELDKYYSLLKPQVIQVPLNIFDQRILNSKWIKLLKKDKVEIHARSIFLQGLLIKKKIPMIFNKKINKHLNLWESWIVKNKIEPYLACLEFVSHQKHIDKFVVGIENPLQLKEILNFKSKKKYNFDKFLLTDAKILHPQNWNI